MSEAIRDMVAILLQTPAWKQTATASKRRKHARVVKSKRDGKIQLRRVDLQGLPQ